VFGNKRGLELVAESVDKFGLKLKRTSMNGYRNVWRQVWIQVWNQVEGQVWKQVEAQVRDQIGNAGAIDQV